MAKYICPSFIREKYSYDKDTGDLLYKINSGMGGRFKVGSVVGSIHKSSDPNSVKIYRRTTIGGERIYVHRLIWIYVTGKQPKEIDHINGNGLDNRWINLREVDHKENAKNQKIHKTNTSGHGGVYFRKDTGKWRAGLMVDGKQLWLGSFKDKQKAINARNEAKIKYGFHENHGV